MPALAPVMSAVFPSSLLLMFGLCCEFTFKRNAVRCQQLSSISAGPSLAQRHQVAKKTNQGRPPRSM
jgi:hypothetical protein